MLTNHSSQNVIVIEIMQGRDPNMCYWYWSSYPSIPQHINLSRHLATSLGMRYAILLSKNRSSNQGLVARADSIIELIRKATSESAGNYTSFGITPV